MCEIKSCAGERCKTGSATFENNIAEPSGWESLFALAAPAAFAPGAEGVLNIRKEYQTVQLVERIPGRLHPCLNCVTSSASPNVSRVARVPERKSGSQCSPNTVASQRL